MIIRQASGTPLKTINFLIGHPSPSLLPASLVSNAAQAVLSNPSTSTPALLYGKDEGYWSLRVSLARWLDDFYGPARRSYASQIADAGVSTGEAQSKAEENAARITITGGASQSLGVILSTFTDPAWTEVVWMVVPAYFLAFKIFQDAGFAGRLRAVPEDDEGVDVGFLEEALEKYERSRARSYTSSDSAQRQWRGNKPTDLYERVYRHVIYVVPTFANPSSRTMSVKRRESLVRVARKFDSLIVCDDVYDMLQWKREETRHAANAVLDKAKSPRLVDVDRHLSPAPNAESFGNVISNGSFTKILGPGMRTGWVEAAPKLAFRLSQTGVQKSGGAPSQIAAVCISNLLEHGKLQNHVYQTLQAGYKQRWSILRAAVARKLEPLGVSVVEQAPTQGSGGLAGGYFVWLTLPEPLRGSTVAEKAKAEENLIVAPGEIFEVPGGVDQSPEHSDAKHFHEEAGHFPKSLRLCFAREEVDLLDEGVDRLSRVISNLMQERRC